ncbi:MAG: DUF975 family protein [Clostridiales bacterium]|jgi:uncharacterized membrane protein|nr:DUF975 family protein [Clostridiales bacterium]
MWDRRIIKSNARIALNGRYWTAFGVCILAAFITSAFSLITTPLTMSYESMLQDFEGNLDAIVAQSGLVNLLSLANILIIIFVGIPLTIGIARFFIQNRFGRTDFSLLFSGFRLNYMGALGALFVTYLFIGLWALLLIIPGIVKVLQYCLVPYILADNPYMPGSRARELSRHLTDGEKGGIFVLSLSFLGWIILALLPYGFISAAVRFLNFEGAVVWAIGQSILVTISVSFVSPYINASFAELYIYLRDRAVQSGQINPAEFGLVPPPAPPADPMSL